MQFFVTLWVFVFLFGTYLISHMLDEPMTVPIPNGTVLSQNVSLSQGISSITNIKNKVFTISLVFSFPLTESLVS